MVFFFKFQFYSSSSLYQEGLEFTLGGPAPLDAPSGKIFVPKASTSPLRF